MTDYAGLSREARNRWMAGIERLGGSLGWLKPVTEGRFVRKEEGREVRFLIHEEGRTLMLVIDDGDDKPGLSLTLELPEGLRFGTPLPNDDGVS